MVRTVRLDDTKHSASLFRGLKQMRQDKEHCDFIIKVQGKEFHTHKVILSLGSPYFKAMLKHNTKERQEGEVEMRDVDCECVKSCIESIYDGIFDIPDGKTGDLLHVAIMMQLDDVRDAISDVLEQELDADKFYETRNIAEMYNMETVSTKCETFYHENFMAITARAEFREEKKSHVANILKSNRWSLSEEQKLTACLRWVGENTKRISEGIELIKLINLKEMSLTFLKDLLSSNAVVNSDFRLYKFITELALANASPAACVTALSTATLAVERERNEAERIIIFDGNCCLQSYDPATKELARFRGKLHTGNENCNETFDTLGYFTVCSVNPHIYVICGDKSVQRLNFRVESSEWERIGDMFTDHGLCPPSTVLLGSIFVIASSDEPTCDIEKFDPVANNWLKLRDKPEGIRFPTLVSLKDSIYCLGGDDEVRETVNSVRKFTPSTSQWADLQPMRHKRISFGAVAVGHKIFVAGETDSHSHLEVYNVASNEWTLLTPMLTDHGATTAHHVDGWIYFFPRRSYSDECEKYDIANDRWYKVELENFEPFRINDSVLLDL